MSRKRFTTMIAVVLLLGAAGLFSLYMTLGRMNTMLRTRGQGAASSAPAPAQAEKLQEMTLTPAGEAELRREQERMREEQNKAPGAPNSAPPAKSPRSDAGSPGKAAGSEKEGTPGTPPAGSR